MGYINLNYDTFLDDIDYWHGDLGLSPPKWAEDISSYGEAISAIDFYDDLFAGQDGFGGDLEPHRAPDDYRSGEYAAIAMEIVDAPKKARYGRRITVTQGCTELYDLIDHSDSFCLIAPISYAGKRRTAANARFMYALCVEIDGIEPKNGIQELFYIFERAVRPLPRPTYVVCSGNGLHLYWCFEHPLPLFKNVVVQLQHIRDYIIFCTWDKQVSVLWEHPQRESLYQAFRCVGSTAKNKSVIVMAFKTGEKLSLEAFNARLPEELRLEAAYKSYLTKAQAKELYPDWYQRRIVEGQERGHFVRHRGIYDSWIEKILAGAEVGHRYHCLENLCSLAVQCEIPPEEVYADCKRIQEKFEEMTNSDDNHFTEHDVLCALSTYETKPETAYRRKIEFVSSRTGIPLTRAKRNGRTQADHVKRMNVLRDFDYPDGSWINRSGAPTKEEIVRKWKAANPERRKADCIRETGLSKNTVYKWW